MQSLPTAKGSNRRSLKASLNSYTLDYCSLRNPQEKVAITPSASSPSQSRIFTGLIPVGLHSMCCHGSTYTTSVRSQPGTDSFFPGICRSERYSPASNLIFSPCSGTCRAGTGTIKPHNKCTGCSCTHVSHDEKDSVSFPLPARERRCRPPTTRAAATALLAWCKF